MKEEKLKQIYESGNLKLCYKMMEAEGIDYLDIDFDWIGHDRINYCESVTRNGVQIRIFNDNNVSRKANISKELYEVSIYKDINDYDISEIEYLKALEDADLQYLSKYIDKDSINFYCFAYIPKHEILKLIFTKKKE